MSSFYVLRYLKVFISHISTSINCRVLAALVKYNILQYCVTTEDILGLCELMEIYYNANFKLVLCFFTSFEVKPQILPTFSNSQSVHASYFSILS